MCGQLDTGARGLPQEYCVGWRVMHEGTLTNERETKRPSRVVETAKAPDV